MRVKLPHIGFLISFTMVFISCEGTKTNMVVDASNVQLNLDNGVLYYQEIPFNGQLTNNYNDGSHKSEVHYKKGRKNGNKKQWFPDGKISISRTYSNGYKTGIHKGWWPDGGLKFEYHFNTMGQYNGTVSEWYSSGQKFMAFNYVNGKECGSQKLWKFDGSIKSNYFVKEGERYGLIGLKKCYAVNQNDHEIK